MSNVIGYKGTPAERRADWLYMLKLKKYREVFGSSIDPWEKKVYTRAMSHYKKNLSSYVNKEAA